MNTSARYDRAQASAPGAHQAGREALRNPIVAALNQMVLSVLGEQLREMFERADDILFDSAEKAQSAEEQRLLMDTMRTLRLQRTRIIDHFRVSLEDALSRVESDAEDAPADIGDISQWSLQDGDALEERLAVSSMENKAASMHAHELGELKRRLATLSVLVGGSLSDEAMSPARIIRAFCDSMKDLTVDFPSRLVIYKLFDRVVLSRLSELFTGANQLLALNGVEPAAGAAAPPPTAKRVRAAHAASAVPRWAGHLDAATMGGFGVQPLSPAPRADAYAPHPAHAGAMLSAVPARWGMGNPSPEYVDAVLAQEIGNILRGYREGHSPDAPAWLPPESVGLVAGMFDRYYRDSRMPDALKPALGKLQMPVLKAALNDPGFFADALHPARRAVNGVFDLMLRFGAGADGDRAASLAELHALIDSFAEAVRLDPRLLQNKPVAAPDHDAVAAFIREQDQLQSRKNDTQIERVRRIVAHELRRHVGDRELPAGVTRLLLSGFGPVLSVDYIRGGPGSESWKESLELVDRVIGSLHSEDADADRRRVNEAEIVAAVSNRLARTGFSDRRLSEVIAGLLEVYLANEESRSSLCAPRAGDAKPAAHDQQQRPAATPVGLSPDKELQGLLSILLVPDTWYTLVDGTGGIKHWVRVKTHYPAQNVVLFCHYMEERFVRWHATSLATALLEGRAALIDPSAELHAAVERLGQLPFSRTHDALEWTGVDGKPIGMEQ